VLKGGSHLRGPKHPRSAGLVLHEATRNGVGAGRERDREGPAAVSFGLVEGGVEDLLPSWVVGGSSSSDEVPTISAAPGSERYPSLPISDLTVQAYGKGG